MPENPYALNLSQDRNPYALDIGITQPAPTRRKKSRKKPAYKRQQVQALVKAAEDMDIERFYNIGSQMELTPRQMKLTWEATQKDNSSFADRLAGKVGGGVVGGASWVFDKMMRPSWAVSSAVSKALEGDTSLDDFNPQTWVPKVVKNPGRLKEIGGAAVSGLKGETRKGFGQVLDEQGVLEGHGNIRGAVGLGLDIATDPLMLASFGTAAPVVAGGRVGAVTAAKAAGREVTAKQLASAARLAGKRALEGDTDDAIEVILKEAGPNFQHRLGLLKLNKAYKGIPAVSLKEADRQALLSQRHMSEAMARAESQLFDPRKVAVHLGSARHGLTLRTPVPMLTRPGAKLSTKGLPVVSQLSDTLGRAFIPGYKNEIFRAGEMAKQHAAEFNHVTQRDYAFQIFGDAASKIDVDKMREALHFMEQPLKNWRAINQVDESFVVNAKYLDHLLKKGLIDDEQAKFILKYHQTMKYFNTLDRAAGVAYENFEQTGRMYVPHVRRPGVDTANIAQDSLLTQAGFQKGRDVAMSLKQVADNIADGKMDDVMETDPMQAMVRRSRSGAERQADMALINTLVSHIGKPSRVVNPAQVARAEARLATSQEKADGAMRLAASMEEAYDEKITTALDELDSVYNQASELIGKKIAADRKGAKAEVLKDLRAKLKRARKPESKAAIEKEIKRVQRSKFSNEWIEKQESNFASLTNDYDKARKALSNPRSKTHKTATKEERRVLETAKGAYQDARRELKNAKAAHTRAKVGKKNPEVGPNDIPMNQLWDDFGNAWTVPKEARETVFRIRKLYFGDEKTVENFERGLGKWMGAWKILMTTVNPGYRVRNTMTDFWNMWVAGVPANQMGKYGAKSARVMHNLKQTKDPIKRAEAFNIIHEAADHGIMSGQFAGDIQSIARMMKHVDARSAAGLAKKGNLMSAFTKLSQDFNRNAENWGRLTHYLYRRQALRESPAEAAFRVKIAHFDYEDLTDFEQGKMKALFPFYTWTRKNIPYQVRQIVAEPGRYSVFPKAVQESSYAASGEEPGGAAPTFVNEAFGFKLPSPFNDTYLMPQMGVSDLEVFQHPFKLSRENTALQRVAAQATPLAKLPFELWLNKNMFTGAPIESERHPRNPVTNIGAELLSLVPGSNVGQTARTGPGMERLTGPGADPQYAHILSQIPWLRTLGVTAGGIKGEQTNYASLLSQLGGISTVRVDPDLQAYYAKLELEEQVDKTIQGLKDEGAVAVTRRSPTRFDKLIDEILKGNY